MKINIASKIFLGFLLIVCLNAAFVLIVSKLTSLNKIVSIVKKQSEIKNSLLHATSLHLKQNTSRIVLGTVNKASTEYFKTTGDMLTGLIDSILTDLRGVVSLDSLVSEQYGENSELLALVVTVDSISRYNKIYNQAFSEFLNIKNVKNNRNKRKVLNSIIDTADTRLKTGFAGTDSLIEQHTMARIKEIENRIDNVKTLTQLILLGMSIFSIGFALLYSRIISHHLHRLKESTSIIAKGDFDFNPRGYPNDEIGDLANAFFDMAHDLKKTQNELIKKRRLAAIGEIVASVNHEINNPLMIISGNAQFLEMTIDSETTKDTKERIRAILEETERISQVTRKLRDIKNPVVEDYTSSGEQMINLDKSLD